MDAALVILDGWGLGRDATFPGHDPADAGDGRDAVAAAETPTFDACAAEGTTTRLRTWGRSVGLPEGQAGNSEVGHLTIGAGTVIDQPFTRIEDAVAEGSLAERPAIADALAHVAGDDARDGGASPSDAAGGRLHLLGLCSDGGVHADCGHLHALIAIAAGRGIEVVTHPFTDGRDTSPTAGEAFLAELEAAADEHGTGHPATVIGRYYAMDRDEHWARTRAAYDAIVEREAEHVAPDGSAAVRAAYDRGETDEFVAPTLVEREAAGDGAATAAPAIRDGDAVVFCNFRADRARQLTRLLGDIDVPDAVRPDGGPPDVHLATMTEYDETYDLPVAFPPVVPEATLGTAVADAGRTQLRVAESEKYAHVTYFLNGGREAPLAGERREIVDSPDVPTYDEAPAMSAAGVTDRLLDAVGGGGRGGADDGTADAGGADDDTPDAGGADPPPDVAVLNYANPDMVGHTGDFEAAVAAVEAVDDELARLVPALREAGASVVLTADHGNADDLGTPEDPDTAHTTNPVPFVALGPGGDVTPEEAAVDAARIAGAENGGLHGLSTVAPTLLSLAGVPTPPSMTGPRLLAGDATDPGA